MATFGFFGRVLGSVFRPTSMIDEYLAESIIPRLQKDATLVEKRFCNAIYYPFNDKTNLPKPLNEIVAANVKRERQSGAEAITTTATTATAMSDAINKKNENNSNTNNNNNANDDRNSSPLLPSTVRRNKFTLHDVRDRVKVVELDCLLYAKQLHESRQFRNIAVLNMANEYNCGGAWSVHTGSQEEYVFRNTTLPFSLWKHRRLDQDGFRGWEAGTKVLGPPKEEDRWYPFTIFGGIYSRPVEVFSICDEKIKNPDEIFEISVLTIAAQDLRNKNSEFPKQVFSLDILRGKMRTLFFMAIENKCDCLVLSALGSGAFLNPPDQVAEMFKAVLQEICDGCESVDDFPFKRVDFAIIKSKENVKAYQQVFSTI